MTLRAVYSNWPMIQQHVRDRVATLSDDQLLLQSGQDRWPMWAIVGHMACQRVFWLCDFAGEPRVETRFTNAAYNCPGDDDLENVLSSAELVAELDSTFGLIEGILDRWPIASLDEVLRRPEWDESWVHTRGAVVQRSFGHDVWHTADLNDTLGRHGLEGIDIWN
jgi:hypothetical protein